MHILLDTDEGVAELPHVLAHTADFIREIAARGEPASPHFLRDCDEPFLFAAKEMAFSSHEMAQSGYTALRMVFLHRSGVIAPLFCDGPPFSPEREQRCVHLIRAFLHANEIAAYCISAVSCLDLTSNLSRSLGVQDGINSHFNEVDALIVRARSRSKAETPAVLSSIIECKPNGDFDRMGPSLEEHAFPGSQGMVIQRDLSPLYENLFIQVPPLPALPTQN